MNFLSISSLGIYQILFVIISVVIDISDLDYFVVLKDLCSIHEFLSNFYDFFIACLLFLNTFLVFHRLLLQHHVLLSRINKVKKLNFYNSTFLLQIPFFLEDMRPEIKIKYVSRSPDLLEIENLAQQPHLSFFSNNSASHTNFLQYF